MRSVDGGQRAALEARRVALLLDASRVVFDVPACGFLTAAACEGLRAVLFEREATVAEPALFLVLALAACFTGGGGAGMINRLPGSTSAAAEELTEAISTRVVR